MSDFTRRVVDGVSSLVDKLGTEDAITEIDPARLAREISDRQTAKSNEDPRANPRARWVGAGPEARRFREKAARERDVKFRAEQKRREHEHQRMQDEAFRRVKADAARSEQKFGSRARQTASHAGARAKEAWSNVSGKDPALAKAYKTLDVPYGSPFAEVRSSYRKLMRRYHPDLHHQTPDKQKAATELSMKVTQAYNVLEKHLR